jgi:hypothetical protein
MAELSYGFKEFERGKRIARSFRLICGVIFLLACIPWIFGIPLTTSTGRYVGRIVKASTSGVIFVAHEVQIQVGSGLAVDTITLDVADIDWPRVQKLLDKNIEVEVFFAREVLGGVTKVTHVPHVYLTFIQPIERERSSGEPNAKLDSGSKRLPPPALEPVPFNWSESIKDRKTSI